MGLDNAERSAIARADAEREQRLALVREAVLENVTFFHEYLANGMTRAEALKLVANRERAMWRFLSRPPNK